MNFKKTLASRTQGTARNSNSKHDDAEDGIDMLEYANAIRRKGRSERRKPQRIRWPDFTAIELDNPNDLFSAHQLLIGAGLAKEEYDSLRQTVLAAILARRLGSTSPTGYFVQTLKQGLHHQVTDTDHEAAKQIIRTIYGYEERERGKYQSSPPASSHSPPQKARQGSGAGAREDFTENPAR